MPIHGSYAQFQYVHGGFVGKIKHQVEDEMQTE